MKIVKRIIKKLLTDQRGTTLVDLLVGIAISGMLLPVIISGMSHLFTATNSSRNQIIALQNIEYAANRIREDVHVAQTTNLLDGAAPVSSLNLSWVDAATSQTHAVSYYLSNNQLQRNDNGMTGTVGRYISSIDFSISNGIIRVKIISNPGVNLSSSKMFTYSLALQ